MKTSVVIFLASIGLLCIASNCDALKCYSCLYQSVEGNVSSQLGFTEACGDDTLDKSKLTLRTCSSHQTCVWAHDLIEVDGKKTMTIGRECSDDCVNFHVSRSGTHLGKILKAETSNGCCDTDGCNGAATIGYLGLNLAITLLVTVYLKF